MGKFKIIHDKPICIGCCSCAAVHPERWVMEEDTGLSHVIDAKKNGEQEIIELDEIEFEKNKEAAEVCPVNCIHLEKKDQRII